jgi:hypothetical protein
LGEHGRLYQTDADRAKPLLEEYLLRGDESKPCPILRWADQRAGGSAAPVAIRTSSQVAAAFGRFPSRSRVFDIRGKYP